MKFKKAIATFVAATIALASVGFQSVAAASFPDMPNDWSRVASEAAVSNGLLAGINGKFMPKATVPRSQVAAVVNRAFGASEMANISGVTDVPQGVWYAGDMGKAVQMGTMVVTNGKLNPTRLATREEVFAILARAFVISPAASTTALNKFSDAGQISSWAKPEMAAMVEAGYVTGSNGKLNPKGNLTREEFAVVMNQMVKTYVAKTGEVTSVNKGNVMVNVPGAVLKGVTIEGDLIIGDGVGSGTVTLDGVKVLGRTVFRTGKEASVDNKNNSALGTVVVHTPSAAQVPLPSTPDHGTQVPATTAPTTTTGSLGAGSGSSGGGSSSSGGGTKPTTVAATGITISSTEGTIKVNGTTNKTLTLTANVTPSDASNKNINWVSSNTSIATISKTSTTSGGSVVVTAVAEGVVEVKATTADGNFTKKCVVTVLPADAATGTIKLNGADTGGIVTFGNVLLSAEVGGVTNATTAAEYEVYYLDGTTKVPFMYLSGSNFSLEMADKKLTLAQYQANCYAVKKAAPALPSLTGKVYSTTDFQGPGKVRVYVRGLAEVTDATTAAKYVVMYKGATPAVEMLYDDAIKGYSIIVDELGASYNAADYTAAGVVTIAYK